MPIQNWGPLQITPLAGWHPLCTSHAGACAAQGVGHDDDVVRPPPDGGGPRGLPASPDGDARRGWRRDLTQHLTTRADGHAPPVGLLGLGVLPASAVCWSALVTVLRVARLTGMLPLLCSRNSFHLALRRHAAQAGSADPLAGAGGSSPHLACRGTSWVPGSDPLHSASFGASSSVSAQEGSLAAGVPPPISGVPPLAGVSASLPETKPRRFRGLGGQPPLRPQPCGHLAPLYAQ